jgi:hypothetical protein
MPVATTGGHTLHDGMKLWASSGDSINFKRAVSTGK